MAVVLRYSLDFFFRRNPINQVGFQCSIGCTQVWSDYSEQNGGRKRNSCKFALCNSDKRINFLSLMQKSENWEQKYVIKMACTGIKEVKTCAPPEATPNITWKWFSLHCPIILKSTCLPTPRPFNLIFQKNKKSGIYSLAKNKINILYALDIIYKGCISFTSVFIRYFMMSYPSELNFWF